MYFTIPSTTLIRMLNREIEETQGFIASMEQYGYPEDASAEADKLLSIIQLRDLLASKDASDVKALLVSHVC